MRLKRIIATTLSLSLALWMVPTAALASQTTLESGAKAASISYIEENANMRTLEGEGTEAKPYLISSVEDLEKIRYYIVDTGIEDTFNTNGTIRTINSQVIDGYFKLECDIDCSSFDAWIPIGRTDANKNVRYKTAFVGTLDGGKDHYTISNLKLSTDFGGVGLFTRVGKGGTVKNLKIEGCETKTDSSTIEVGAVCGTAWGSTFSNISLSNIKLKCGTYAGALSGDIWASGEVGTTVVNCSVADSTISGGAATGGLIGRSSDSTNTLSRCSVSNTGVTANGHSVAGLAGILNGQCEGCQVTDVSVTSNWTSTPREDAYAGGLFGQGSSTLTNCSASGTVHAGNDGQHAGGLGAYYTGSKIENCSAKVDVTAKNHVGGLIGFISATTEVKDCHATGDVTITAATSGNHSAGGLIGRIKDETITNCYATGKVKDLSNAPVSGNSTGVGGLIGVADSSNISESYATGEITGPYAVAGGLIGKSSSTVQKCYATGRVTGAGMAGGFAGEASGTIENSYATGAVSGATKVGGFVGSISGGTSIITAAASGNVAATEADGIAGGFVGFSNGTPNIKSALALGEVSAATAGAFIGSAAAVVSGLNDCYANSASAVPFTGTVSSGYYSPQNCFYAGAVTGMLASGSTPNGSSWQNYDYYYAKMDFSKAITGSYGDALALEQTNTIGSNVADETPKHNLTVKVSPETLVSVGDDGSLKASAAGEGTLSLVLTVNGEDFTFGTANVDIKAKAVNVTMSDSTVDYDGTPKEIAVSDTDLPGDLQLVYSYTDSTGACSTTPPADAGIYTVKVESGDSNHTLSGSTIATLTINHVALSGKNVALDGSSYPYTGAAIEPALAVTAGGKTLAKGTDYEVNFSNNTAVGTATVTVTGKGNYSGTVTKTFEITKVTPVLSITPSATTLYGGGTVTLAVGGLPAGVKAAPVCEGVTLTENQDGTYSAALPNATKTYTFTVSLKGDGTNYNDAADATCTVSVTYSAPYYPPAPKPEEPIVDPEEPAAPEAPAKGVSVTVEGGSAAGAAVTVTAPADENGKGGTVVFKAPASSKASSVSIPKSVKIGDATYTVTEVAAYAFKGNSKLKSVTLPSTVTKIGRSAFSGCTKLGTVTVGSKVTSIGKNAFYKAGAKKLIVKSKKLTKKSIKDCLKSSNITTVVIKVSSSKKINKSFAQKYANAFAKANSGKKVKVTY